MSAEHEASDGLEQLVYIEKGVYLRLRYIRIPSISCMYVNPCSSRSVASLMFDAVLQVYSSSSLKCISCVYIIVVSIFLCPSCCFTSMMSLVFA